MLIGGWRIEMQTCRCSLAILCAMFLSLLLPNAARAEVTITFYSHELDDHFPHAFIKLTGTVGSTGDAVDTNYGFTARSTSPAILWGSVGGMIETKNAKYVRSSKPHFTFRLADADYRRVLELVNKWRNIPGKSYNLGKRNCVHFAMEVAALLGLSINRQTKFLKKPTSFMLELLRLNPELKL
jgi:hypothetical protein